MRQRIGSDPYIDFISVGGSEELGFFEDEDSPVDGGLSLKTAETIAAELIRAVAYAKSLKKKGG